MSIVAKKNCVQNLLTLSIDRLIYHHGTPEWFRRSTSRHQSGIKPWHSHSEAASRRTRRPVKVLLRIWNEFFFFYCFLLFSYWQWPGIAWPFWWVFRLFSHFVFINCWFLLGFLNNERNLIINKFNTGCFKNAWIVASIVTRNLWLYTNLGYYYYKVLYFRCCNYLLKLYVWKKKQIIVCRRANTAKGY